MEHRLNIIIGLLIVMLALMLVNMYILPGNGMHSDAKMKIDDCRVAPTDAGC